MNSKSRITSILKANHLGSSITNFPVFDLSDLKVIDDLNFELPTNVRLGHLAEALVSEAIKVSTNYEVLFENMQIIKDKNTIGEIDFIIRNLETKQNIHLELAYKFYLFDPTISDEPIQNWIGPNRRDSLVQKLDKLKSKQFPLLYHSSAQSHFEGLHTEEITQALCLLVSLFIPYQYKASLDQIDEQAIKGYYINLSTFINLNSSDKKYHIPTKKEWGIDPSENELWTSFEGIEHYIRTSIAEKQAPFVWQKHNETYLQFFVVWW
ncbi:MAG: DUF1853 family protein [Crocinitomicaceae bacterium]